MQGRIMKAVWRTSAMSYPEITSHNIPNSKRLFRSYYFSFLTKWINLIISHFWWNEKPRSCLFAGQKGPFFRCCHVLFSTKLCETCRWFRRWKADDKIEDRTYIKTGDHLLLYTRLYLLHRANISTRDWIPIGMRLFQASPGSTIYDLVLYKYLLHSTTKCSAVKYLLLTTCYTICSTAKKPTYRMGGYIYLLHSATKCSAVQCLLPRTCCTVQYSTTKKPTYRFLVFSKMNRPRYFLFLAKWKAESMSVRRTKRTLLRCCHLLFSTKLCKTCRWFRRWKADGKIEDRRWIEDRNRSPVAII